MAMLIVRDGPLAGHTVEIESPLVIGRQDAGLTIEDPAVSRQHARFEQANGGLQVIDLGSSNGTWVNGVRIEAPTRLRSGDVVMVGKTSIEIRADVTQVLDRPVEAGHTQVLPTPEAGQQPAAGERQTAVRSRPAVQTPSTPAPARPEPVAPAAAAARPAPSRVEVASAAAAAVAPAPAAAAAPALAPFSPPAVRKRRGAASRMPAPIIFTFLTVIATGVVLILYFALWAPPR